MKSRLEQLFSPIRIGIIGMGAMGKGLLYQAKLTPGFRCVAIADLIPKRAIDCLKETKDDHVLVANLNEMEDAVRSGKVAVTVDGSLVAGCECIDLLIEASTGISESGLYCQAALENGKHVIMMNSEADLVFGPYLLELARQHGVVYSSCDGDQHGVIKQLFDEMVLWGFEPVMAGNIKGFLDRYSDPTKIIPEADKRQLDYKMASAYTDGTKLNIEMSLLANALNMRTLIPGMFGPEARLVGDVFRLYDFKELWKDRQPFVDYILGAEPGGGVFAIGYCDNSYQQFMMNYYKMGAGPFYLFYRPYHLCHVESMKWIAKAALDNESLLQPDYGFRTNVIAYSKKELQAGELLDGIGGYCCYGLIENQNGHDSGGLPICLSDGARLKKALARDQRIALDDVEWNPDDTGMKLFFKSIEAARKWNL